MRFLRRHSPEPAPEPEVPSVTRAVPLSPVAVFLEAEVAEGWVVTQERRLSERLNAGELLHMQLATADAEPGPWLDYPSEEVIAVAVEPRFHPSPLRVSRRRHVMGVDSESLRVFGDRPHAAGCRPNPLRRQRIAAMVGANAMHRYDQRNNVGG